MALGAGKELKPIIRQAERQGWIVTQTKASHLRWKSPGGRSVFSALTPSDWRATRNILRMLKEAGFKENVK